VDATHEEWRPVVGDEGSYEVSSHGRVRSLDRTIVFPDGRKRLARGRILKPWAQVRGRYPAVGVGTKDGKKQKRLIHTLVLEAFIGPRPEGFACCHNDGDSENNHLSNLRWDSYSENNHDLVRHGTHWNASKTQCPQGHEYSPENTRIYIHRGWTLRYCRVCEYERRPDHNERRRAQRRASPRKRGPQLQNECSRGHQYTPDNTYTRPDGGGRQCRQCNRINGERRRSLSE
jgi:hypothetical protein